MDNDIGKNIVLNVLSKELGDDNFVKKAYEFCESSESYFKDTDDITTLFLNIIKFYESKMCPGKDFINSFSNVYNNYQSNNIRYDNTNIKNTPIKINTDEEDVNTLDIISLKKMIISDNLKDIDKFILLIPQNLKLKTKSIDSKNESSVGVYASYRYFDQNDVCIRFISEIPIDVESIDIENAEDLETDELIKEQADQAFKLFIKCIPDYIKKEIGSDFDHGSFLYSWSTIKDLYENGSTFLKISKVVDSRYEYNQEYIDHIINHYSNEYGMYFPVITFLKR